MKRKCWALEHLREAFKLKNKYNPKITNKLKMAWKRKTTLHFCYLPLWLDNVYQGESTDICTQIRYRSHICKSLWRIWCWHFETLLWLFQKQDMRRTRVEAEISLRIKLEFSEEKWSQFRITASERMRMTENIQT